MCRVLRSGDNMNTDLSNLAQLFTLFTLSDTVLTFQIGFVQFHKISDIISRGTGNEGIWEQFIHAHHMTITDRTLSLTSFRRKMTKICINKDRIKLTSIYELLNWIFPFPSRHYDEL